MIRPVTVRMVALADGSVRCEVRCPCLAVSATRASWEDRAPVLARLGDEHGRRAPLCPHRPARTPAPALPADADSRP